jgi:ATP-binding cassette, subfamily F, member 3
MAVAIASGLGKDVAGKRLLRNVSFKVERGQRLALSGRNGSGKTTLLRMLAGELPIDEGELSLEKDARVALHDQRPPREQQLSLRDYVLSGCADLVALEEQLGRLEQEMASGSTGQATLHEYAVAQARLEHAGGYDWRRRATAVVRGLGFGDEDLDRPLRTFSGGELTRGSLARTLAGDPDLLLLDEPTNHLDVASLEWLEGQLTAADAAIVLVAHDRWFLESVGTGVLELEAGRSRFFAGPWHMWRKEKAAREVALSRAIDRQQAEIERLERFVTRFRAGTRSRQAQMRVKRLEKIDRLERDPQAGRAPGFKFKEATRSGRVALELEGATIAAGEHKLLEGAALWLERGEHVTLVGPNGAGKTTLIETLAGRIPLGEGKLRRGHNVELGFLSQHAQEIGGEGTVLEAAQRGTGLPPNKARALLGRFLFSGADAEKEVTVLSGGELRRLSLAILVDSGANVLILDEPTNHLDLESREALEDALRAFDGGLLLVSHDRALLDAVGARTIAIEDGALRSYAGGWSDYLRMREERSAAAESSAGKEERGGPGGRRRAGQAPRPSVSKNRKRRIAELERAVADAEAALSTIEDELADPACWATPERSAESTARHEEAQSRVEQLYEELVGLDPKS